MGKFLLSTLLLLTTAFASTAETITFDNGLPDGWQKVAGTVANQTRVSKKCLQLQKGASISSPLYSNISEIKLSLNISSNATSFTVAQSSDNVNWTPLRTIAKSECSTSSWTDFSISTQGDTSNGVYFKLSSDAASYYISTFEYTVASTEDSDKCATPVAKVRDKVVVGNDKLFVNDELTFSCSTEGATITYSLIGGEYNVNNEVFDGNPIKLNKAALYTIKAKATVDGKDASDELVIEDIDVVKRHADISFAKSTAAAYLDAISEFSAPELLNPNKLEGISYTSSNPEIAAVAADGTVAPIAAGETTITAAFAGNDEYEAAKAEYVLTIMNEKPNLPKFKKVTSVEELEDGAHYVIAYENQDGSKAMGVALEDDFRQATDVVISEGVLEATDNTLIITLEGSVNSWKFNAENYFGTDKYLKFNQTNTTKILMTSESDATAATITFSTQGNVQIRGNVDGGTRYIKYNTATDQFRYYAETTGSMCQLYREIIDVEPEAPAMPEIHPEHADKVNVNTISGEGSMNIKFADVEDHINLYYRFIDNTDEPETVALDETTDNHEGYELYDKVNGLNLGTEHDGKTLEVYACDSNTGKHSEAAQYKISMLTVGVEEIEAAGVGEVRWFDMQGREVKGQPEKGIYVRVANGKASKVIL